MIRVNKDVCIGCGACEGVCPTGSLKLGEDGRCSCTNESCVECLACVPTCPVNAIENVTEEPVAEAEEKPNPLYEHVKNLELDEFAGLLKDLIGRWAKDHNCEYSTVEKKLNF